MTKFTKAQAKARGALGKGVAGVTGAMNKIAHVALSQAVPREIMGSDGSMGTGLSTGVDTARTALTSMSVSGS